MFVLAQGHDGLFAKLGAYFARELVHVVREDVVQRKSASAHNCPKWNEESASCKDFVCVSAVLDSFVRLSFYNCSRRILRAYFPLLTVRFGHRDTLVRFSKVSHTSKSNN